MWKHSRMIWPRPRLVSPRNDEALGTMSSPDLTMHIDLARKFSHRRTRSTQPTNGAQTVKVGGGSTTSAPSSQGETTTATTHHENATPGTDRVPMTSIDGTTETITETGMTSAEEGSAIKIEDSATEDIQSDTNIMENADTGWDNDDAPRPSHSSDRPSQTPDVLTSTSDTPRSSVDVSSTAQSIRDDPENASRDEEIQTYLERIDALSAKLQYLAKDAAETAQHTATTTSRDSTVHQLALKDEQIALLMEEGQKLSKLELAHTTIIKKLRSKAVEDVRSQAQMSQRLAKADRLGAELSAKVARMEAAQKDSQTKMSRLLRLEEETVRLRNDNEAKRALVADLQSRLAESEKELASTDGLAKTLQVEKDETTRLREELHTARTEHKDYEGRSRKETSALHEELEIAQSKIRATSAEFQTEISVSQPLRAYSCHSPLLTITPTDARIPPRTLPVARRGGHVEQHHRLARAPAPPDRDAAGAVPRRLGELGRH